MGKTTKNLWIQPEYPMVTWVAELGAARTRPADLLEFIDAVLAAGLRHRVFELTRAPAIDHHADGAAVSARVQAIYRERSILALFSFTGAAMAPGAPGSSTAGAVLAWFERDDRLVEGWCEDPGALLRALEPVPDSIPGGFTRSFPPLRITGPRLDYTGPSTEPARFGQGRPLEVRFAVHSDIWLPWVLGSAHPECDHRRWFDNRELATRHTPRLNAFLGAVSAAAGAIGGSWSVDHEETARFAIPWVGATGIDLDKSPDPSERMPPGMLDVEWF